MTIPKITPYSGGVANPDGSQTQTEFTQNMFDQLSYEAGLSTELNNTVDGINDTATQVDSDATSAAQSASSAEAAASGLNYQGLWPDTDGSADKGDTYQTQVSGTPTGQYFTALQNTTVDPISDNINWRKVITAEFVLSAQSEVLGGELYNNSGDPVSTGDLIPLGIDYLSTTFGIVQWWDSPTLPATFNNITLNDTGGYDVSLSTGTFEAVTRDTYSDRINLKPQGWGIVPDDTSDSLTKWQAFIGYYDTLTYATAAVPNFSTGPKIQGFGGASYLSAPLVWAGSYYFGNLQGVDFKRHASWSEPSGTYLLQFPDIYGADFGGLIGEGVDYFAEFSNNNVDVTQVNIDGIQSKRGNWVYKFDLKSAIVYLNNYRFNQSLTALHIDRCDRFYLGRGVVRQGVMTEDKSATIQVDNAVLIAQEGAIGIPNGDNGLAGAPSELAWFNFGRAGVDNTGLSDLRAFRAGGESGSVALANSWIVPDTTYPAVPSGLIVENNDVYSTATNGGTIDSCIIRLFRVPNQLVYRDNRGMVDTNSIISWGQGVDQDVELQKLVGTTVKSFVLDGNVTSDLYARFAPENIRNLFEVRGRINFGTISRPDANNIKIDCGIVPLGKVVSFALTVAPSTADPSYRTSVKGEVMVKIGNSGGPAQRLELVNYAEARGGSTFVDDIVVTPVFLDSGSEVTEVASDNDTATLRLLVSSINGNAATAILQGYFKVESYLL